MGNENRQLTGFLIQDDLFGVSVLDVQEVIKPQKVTRVPLADERVRGLINLRGQIVTLVDLRKLFNLPVREGEDYMNVIVRTEDGLVALMVDEIRDVMDLSDDTFEERPETLSKDLLPFVEGIHRLDGHLLTVLDLNKILEIIKGQEIKTA